MSGPLSNPSESQLKNCEAVADPRSVLRQPAVLKLIVIALLAEIAYAVLNISTMPVYLKEDRQFGETAIGFVLVFYLLVEAIFKGPMGSLADKYGPRLLMTIGPGLSVLTTGASFIIPHQHGSLSESLIFMALRAVDGLGAAMLWPAAYATVGDSVAPGERQQAMSYLNLCYMLGLALALPIGGIVNTYTQTHWASLILAIILFALISLLCFLTIPARPVKVSEEHGTSFQEMIQCLKRIPEILLIAVVIFAGIGFPMAIIKLFSFDEFRMTEAGFGGLVFPAAIAMAVLSVPLSKFGERFGRIKSIHYGTGMCSLGLALIASGVVLPQTRTPLVLAIGAIPIGLGFLLAIPAWMAVVSDLDESRRGVNLGAVMTAQGVGAIIGLPIGSAMYEKLKPLGIHLGFGTSFAHYSPFVGCFACITFGWLLGLKILHEPTRAQPEMLDVPPESEPGPQLP